MSVSARETLFGLLDLPWLVATFAVLWWFWKRRRHVTKGDPRLLRLLLLGATALLAWLALQGFANPAWANFTPAFKWACLGVAAYGLLAYATSPWWFRFLRNSTKQDH